MNIFTVFQQMLILFSIMAIGIWGRKKNYISKTTSTQLSFLVINVFNPVLTIYSVLGQSLVSTGSMFYQNLVLIGFFYLILFIAGILFNLIIKPAKNEKSIYRMLMLFPNIGFMGIPVVSALLGSEYIIYVAIYMLVYNLLFYTIGISLAKKSAKKEDIPYTEQKKSRTKNNKWKNFQQLFFNPGIISSVIALIVFFFQIPVPDSICSLLNYLGMPCVPLSMILIGCSVADCNLKTILQNKYAYLYTIFKTLILPISFAFLSRCIPFDKNILTLFIIMASMPAGTLVALAVEQYNSESSCATDCIIFSTLALLFTLPIVSLFL